MGKKLSKAKPTEKLYTFGYFPECGYRNNAFYSRAIQYHYTLWATSKRNALAKLKKLNLRLAYLTDTEPKQRRDYELSSALMEASFKDRRKKASHMDAIHSLTFEVYLGVKSGVINTDEALGDMGLLHEFTHAIFSREWAANFHLEQQLVISCLRMELKIPGLLSSKEKEQHRKKIAVLTKTHNRANSYS